MTERQSIGTPIERNVSMLLVYLQDTDRAYIAIALISLFNCTEKDVLLADV